MNVKVPHTQEVLNLTLLNSRVREGENSMRLKVLIFVLD